MNWEALLSDERLAAIPLEGFDKELWDEFEKSQQTAIQSAAFRRLQDRTQVFPLDKNDFVRTRLTHSLETAFAAKQLANLTRKRLKRYNRVSMHETESMPDILFCVGLLHDTGNPPFDHFGEAIIRDWFRNHLRELMYGEESVYSLLNKQQRMDLENFEGNAQTPRSILRLPFSDSEFGMNLTAAVINTLIKYPCCSKDIDDKAENIRYHKMGFFQADEELVQRTYRKTGTLAVGSYIRHPLMFLLETADDIPYGVTDVEDSFKKGLFSYHQLRKKIADEIQKYDKNDKYHYVKEAQQKLMELYVKELELCGSMKDAEMYAVQNWLQYIKDWLMWCMAYSFNINYTAIMKGEYHRELLKDTYHEKALEILKETTKDYAFTHTSITKLEISAYKFPNSLLDKFVPAIIYFDCKNAGFKQQKIDKKVTSLLSSSRVVNYRREASKLEGEYKECDALYLRLLLITNFLSGMIDTYAETLYHELDAVD